MNEREFAKHILHNIAQDKELENWYTNFMEATNYYETETRLINALENKELTTTQVIRLCLFIGITTELGVIRKNEMS